MKSWIFIGLLLAVMGGGAYTYYTATTQKIEGLIADNSTLKSNVNKLLESNETNNETINQLQADFAEVRKNYIRVEDEFQEIRTQNNAIKEQLENVDLSALAIEDPQAVQDSINRASRDSLRCFEILSGSPLTEAERNAENAQDFNSECPFFWPNNP